MKLDELIAKVREAAWQEMEALRVAQPPGYRIEIGELPEGSPARKAPPVKITITDPVWAAEIRQRAAEQGIELNEDTACAQ